MAAFAVRRHGQVLNTQSDFASRYLYHGALAARPGGSAERTREKPDSSSSRNISPSGRAPPIHEAQSLGSFTIDCESCFPLTMSVKNGGTQGAIELRLGALAPIACAAVGAVLLASGLSRRE